MLANCRISDHGWLMWRRRAAADGCSAATQKRSVETICLLRERSRRYSATATAETAPNAASICRSERFRKYMTLLVVMVHHRRTETQSSHEREDSNAKPESTEKTEATEPRMNTDARGGDPAF